MYTGKVHDCENFKRHNKYKWYTYTSFFQNCFNRKPNCSTIKVLNFYVILIFAIFLSFQIFKAYALWKSKSRCDKYIIFETLSHSFAFLSPFPPPPLPYLFSHSYVNTQRICKNILIWIKLIISSKISIFS